MGKFFANNFMAENAFSTNILQPLLSFGFRFYVAFVFFKSGLTKVDDKFQVTQSTKDLFANEFNIPFLSADNAAFLATYAELILPVLLVLGLFTRPAALALFILNAVATWALAQTGFASAVGQWQHIVWGVMLAVIFAYGPSLLSIDSWLSAIWKNRYASLSMKLIGIIVCSIIGFYLLNSFFVS